MGGKSLGKTEELWRGGVRKGDARVGAEGVGGQVMGVVTVDWDNMKK